MPSRCCTSLTMRLSVRVQPVTLISLQADLFLNWGRTGWLLVIEPSGMIYTFLFQYSNKARHQLKWGRLNWFYPFCFIQKTFSLQTFLLLPHICGKKKGCSTISSMATKNKGHGILGTQLCHIVKTRSAQLVRECFLKDSAWLAFSHVSSSVI